MSNPLTIPGDWLEQEAAKGCVEWMLHQDNMLPHIPATDVVVLPAILQKACRGPCLRP